MQSKLNDLLDKLDKQFETKPKTNNSDEDFIWVPTTPLDVEEAEEMWMPDGMNKEDWTACIAVETIEKECAVDSIICAYLILKRKRKKTDEEIQLLERIKSYYSKYYEEDWPGYLKLIENAKKQVQFTAHRKRYYLSYAKQLDENQSVD